MILYNKVRYPINQKERNSHMAIAPVASSNYQVDLEHLENLTRCVSSLTIDPLKSFVYYLFPFLESYTSNYVEMRLNNSAQEKANDETANHYFGHENPTTGKPGYSYIIAENIPGCRGSENLTENFEQDPLEFNEENLN